VTRREWVVSEKGEKVGDGESEMVIGAVNMGDFARIERFPSNV